MNSKTLTTDCCIAGGGPAGMMLGYLLARAEIEVVVLEKWPDFFRDFRGDTIHPSVMEILNDLGLLDEFLKLPHSKVQRLEGDIGNEKVIMVDLSHLRVHCPFIALIPQWDFLNFIAGKAKQYPSFHLLMETEATDVIKENGRITGVRVKNKGEGFEIHSALVVGADGRSSTVRSKSGVAIKSYGVPMDVLWFCISRKETDTNTVFGRVEMGMILILLNRNNYWQCGFLIRKGDFDNIKRQGLDTFRLNIAQLLPALADRLGEIDDWGKVKLLTVTIDHLPQWYCPGLLCIGDSAHAMSPIGGVGINLAIQDAVAAANILVPAFREGHVSLRALAKVQQRRSLPVKIIQRIQVFIQNRIISRVLGNRVHVTLPWQFRLLKWFPLLRRIPAYIVGIGFRAEHVNANIIRSK